MSNGSKGCLSIIVSKIIQNRQYKKEKEKEKEKEKKTSKKFV